MPSIVKEIGKSLLQHVGAQLLWIAIGLLVIVTVVRSKPRRGISTTDFRPSWGVRIVLWLLMGVWAMLILAALDVGMNWLALLFGFGPLIMLWRWPATILVDELGMTTTTLLRAHVSIHWAEVASVTPSDAGDSLIVRAHDGRTIALPNSLSGVQILASIIRERVGIHFPEWDPFGPV